MASTVNAGGRLDRLPVGPFHYRVMWLIGIGMFFDGFDIYVAGTVLASTLKSGFSTIGQNAIFVSVTFIGMMIGSFLTGFLGDRYGRRFTYQANLLIFGFASLAAAFAPSMTVLIGFLGFLVFTAFPLYGIVEALLDSWPVPPGIPLPGETTPPLGGTTLNPDIQFCNCAPAP